MEIESTTAALEAMFVSIDGTETPYTAVAARRVLCSDSYSKANRTLNFAAEKNFRASQYGSEFKKRFHHRFKHKVNRQVVSTGWETPSVDRGFGKE